jgi:hypothetical protein
MIEAATTGFRLDPTSILDEKVFWHLDMLCMGDICVHPYSDMIHLWRSGVDIGVLCRPEPVLYVVMSWLRLHHNRLQTGSHIHIRCIQSVLAP